MRLLCISWYASSASRRLSYSTNANLDISLVTSGNGTISELFHLQTAGSSSRCWNVTSDKTPIPWILSESGEDGGRWTTATRRKGVVARCDRSRHVRLGGLYVRERKGASWGLRLSLVRSGRKEDEDVVELDGEKRTVSMGTSSSVDGRST